MLSGSVMLTTSFKGMVINLMFHVSYKKPVIC